MVNQPRLPRTHVAAISAPRANAVRSRAVWVSVIVSAGPSNPIVCVPGMRGRHIDRTRKPRRLHRPLERQRGSRRRVLFRDVMRLVEPRSVVALIPHELGRSRHECLEQQHAS